MKINYVVTQFSRMCSLSLSRISWTPTLKKRAVPLAWLSVFVRCPGGIVPRAYVPGATKAKKAFTHSFYVIFEKASKNIIKIIFGGGTGLPNFYES